MTGRVSAQLPLDLAPVPAYERHAFLPSESNRRALEAVIDWRNWRGGRLVLSGPAASGKTHLAQIWAAAAGATVVDGTGLHEAPLAALAAGNVAVENADRVAGAPEPERALLHLHNALGQSGRWLLLTSRAEPGRWGVGLADLASRIEAADHVRLAPPDDALLAAVLVKLFDDRGIQVAPRLIGWLVRRMDRSLAAAEDLVARLDAAALASGGPVTRRMAAAILDNRAADRP